MRAEGSVGVADGGEEVAEVVGVQGEVLFFGLDDGEEGGDAGLFFEEQAAVEKVGRVFWVFEEGGGDDVDGVDGGGGEGGHWFGGFAIPGGGLVLGL